jgi:hypothetical protein
MSESTAPRPALSSPAPRSGLRDAAVLAGGAALTVLFAVALTRRPLAAGALLALVAAGAFLLLAREHAARIRVDRLLAAGLLLLPLAALLGPSFAIPGFPQLFLFRLLLVAILAVGAVYLVVWRGTLRFAAQDLALLVALWFAWLCVGLLWSPDKPAGFTYLAVVVTMLAALAGAASAGGTRRRLRALVVTLTIAYVFIVGFSVLESATGIRMPTSRLLNAVTSQSYAVTSVFHNQNDLATYLAICWPFLLGAFVFSRRPWVIALAGFLTVLGAAAFIRTGSRSSLLAIGISTLAAAALFAHLGPRMSGRTGKVVAVFAGVVLVAGAGYLLFNDSPNPMLRQFRLEALVRQAQTQTGSGAIRTSLTDRGLQVAGGSLFVGAGPGQAQGIIASGADAPGIANLHNWWLETYADGGLVGFGLHLLFFALLTLTLWPLARSDPDPLVRYLASGTVLALLGFTIGALGPSSSVSFAPMWILYGLGLAVVSRARLAAAEGTPDPAEDAA